MKIKFVQQNTDNDCVLACVAMITGENLKDMHEKYNIKLPLSMDSAIKILTLNGYVCERQLKTKLTPDGVYFITVPSLNKNRLNHLIIADTRRGRFALYDPATGKENKKFYSSTDDIFSWTAPIKITDASDILKEVSK